MRCTAVRSTFSSARRVTAPRSRPAHFFIVRHSSTAPPRVTIQEVVKITISKENYLKAIAEAESEGETVIAATLTRWLNVSAPAVTMAIRRLKRDALIHVNGEGHIALTADGREIANRLITRHHLIERMLTEIFGMEWYKVHDEAEQLEHAVSADFERRLIEKLGETDASCPHGNLVGMDTPEDRRSRGLRPLDELDAPEHITVVSVFERDRRLLEYLEGLGVRPGVSLDVVARNYDETWTLRAGGRSLQIGRPVASKVWVRREVPSF
ncbi:MAG: metal-dependent transcriptional regulator [Acidobacteria bacterium]|nr:metal-dependent transcriptional regulator [Acidobacteriota bacterium]